MDKYQEQAEKFLSDTNTSFKAEFQRYGKHFQDDKQCRDIYTITLKRGDREFVFDFGQSLKDSSKLKGNRLSYKGTPPTAYDVLACLTKCDVGTLEDFCGEFGYDEDSKKAEKIYNATLNEWHNIKMLFTDEEIEKLQEIN